MITQTVTVTERNTQNIIIGRRGTYNTEEIVFDLAPLISQFGDGTAMLLVKRSADASAYPAVTERNGSNLVWTISDTDTYYKGHGKCELYWYVDGGLAKTAIWSLTVLRDLGETTEAPPDPYETWVDTLVDLGAETLENAQAAAQSASDANGYKYEAYGYARGAAESQYYAEQARNQAQTARQGAEAARNEAWEISSHYPTIIDGYWAVWHDGQYWKTSYKAEGVDVTCETAPHYLLLDDSMLEEDGKWKMNPPLRSADDREALIEGLIDGTIDCIATDHAPHSAEEKSRGLEKSAFGIVGIETAFPLLYTYLVQPGIISMDKLEELLVYNPRRRFGIPLGNDYSVWNLGVEWTITPEIDFLSKGRATPFEGWRVTGANVLTVCDGKIAYKWGD